MDKKYIEINFSDYSVSIFQTILDLIESSGICLIQHEGQMTEKVKIYSLYENPDGFLVLDCINVIDINGSHNKEKYKFIRLDSIQSIFVFDEFSSVLELDTESAIKDSVFVRSIFNNILSSKMGLTNTDSDVINPAT